MNVTDEMVETALTAWKETNVMFGDLHALMHAALEAALSHAAGQEVVECIDCNDKAPRLCTDCACSRYAVARSEGEES